MYVLTIRDKKRRRWCLLISQVYLHCGSIYLFIYADGRNCNFCLHQMTNKHCLCFVCAISDCQLAYAYPWRFLMLTLKLSFFVCSLDNWIRPATALGDRLSNKIGATLWLAELKLRLPNTATVHLSTFFYSTAHLGTLLSSWPFLSLRNMFHPFRSCL